MTGDGVTAKRGKSRDGVTIVTVVTSKGPINQIEVPE
jgi:hypothetical protein